MNDKSQKLKPCAFCGCGEVYLGVCPGSVRAGGIPRRHKDGRLSIFIECQCCLVTMFQVITTDKSAAQVIDAAKKRLTRQWNTRLTPEQFQEQNKRRHDVHRRNDVAQWFAIQFDEDF